MKVDAYYFNKDGYLREFYNCQEYENSARKSIGIAYIENKKIFNPMDRSWSYWFYKKEIDTSIYNEFEIPPPNKNITYHHSWLIEIDDDFLWVNDFSSSKLLYSCKSIKLWDDTKNMICPPPIDQTYKTFEDIFRVIDKITNRNLKLNELLK